MSLIPVFFHEWWDVPLTPSSRTVNRDLSLADHLLAALAASANLEQQQRTRCPRNRSQLVKPQHGDDRYQINLDVQQFRPEEISVKSTDREIIIEGKHEEQQDEHGFVSRNFVRRYVLPEGYNMQQIVSSLSSDGVLSITAPKVEATQHQEARAIPIVQTGRPAEAIADSKKKKQSPEPENGTAATNGKEMET